MVTCTAQLKNALRLFGTSLKALGLLCQMATLNKDYQDIFRALLNAEVKFLLVGAYALAAYSFPRATKDLYIWVLATVDNANKIYTALAEFGALLDQIRPRDFEEAATVFQIGVNPRRIDLITAIDGVDFTTAYADKIEVEIDSLSIPINSKAHLIQNTKASGRPQDRVDVELLENATE